MTPRGLRVLALSVVLGCTAVLLSGCSWSEVLGLGWPNGITPEAHLNRELWIGSVIASLVVGAIVWGLIFWSSAFHRHKKGETELPRQFGYNMPLELVLTVTPFLIISVLFYFTVVVQEKMLHKDPNPEVVIDVTAFQWNWKFGYQKIAFKDGTLNYDAACRRLMDGVGFTKARAQADVNWYTSSPTVPMSYLLGRLEVERLHAHFVGGEGWSLKQFNDWMLSHGAIPWRWILEARMRG